VTRSNTTQPQRAFARILCAAAFGVASLAASAAPVVVGSYDPATKQSLAFYDLLVSSFADGTPITKLYTAYSRVSKAFFLVRGGRHANGAGCRKEVFRLVPVAGNRLALADPAKPSTAWQANQILTQIFATFDCTSFACMDCISSDPSDPLGAGTNLEQPSCVCNPDLASSAQGECTTTKPGLGGPYGAGEIVVQPPA